jgi:hypothetical protein
MTRATQVEQLASRTDRFVKEEAPYEYHVYGTKEVMHYRVYGEIVNGPAVYEKDPYSKVQNFLYKRAMFGLKIYNQEEIRAMHWQKRKRIRKTHKRAQKILNTWKQELVIELTNKLFSTLFAKSPLVKDMLAESSVDSEVKNMLNFTDLGVTKEMIVTKLVDSGVLPPDYYALK